MTIWPEWGRGEEEGANGKTLGRSFAEMRMRVSNERRGTCRHDSAIVWQGGEWDEEKKREGCVSQRFVVWFRFLEKLQFETRLQVCASDERRKGESWWLSERWEGMMLVCLIFCRWRERLIYLFFHFYETLQFWIRVIRAYIISNYSHYNYYYYITVISLWGTHVCGWYSAEMRGWCWWWGGERKEGIKYAYIFDQCWPNGFMRNRCRRLNGTAYLLMIIDLWFEHVNLFCQCCEFLI